MAEFLHWFGFFCFLFVVIAPFITVVTFIAIKMGWLPGVKLPWER